MPDSALHHNMSELAILIKSTIPQGGAFNAFWIASLSAISMAFRKVYVISLQFLTTDILAISLFDRQYISLMLLKMQLILGTVNGMIQILPYVF